MLLLPQTRRPSSAIPGTLQKVMVKGESSAAALSLMTAHNLDAVAVVDDAQHVLGVVEREQLVSYLILSLVPR
jgi:CBS-domain-containing membrane protein